MRQNDLFIGELATRAGRHGRRDASTKRPASCLSRGGRRPATGRTTLTRYSCWISSAAPSGSVSGSFAHDV